MILKASNRKWRQWQKMINFGHERDKKQWKEIDSKSYVYKQFANTQLHIGRRIKLQWLKKVQPQS
jgi:hypothetical protein